MDVEDKNSHGGESWGATIGSGGGNVGGKLKKMKKKFVAPICSCGDYTILFQSTTSTNPNKFFFGCQNFKMNMACFYDNERGNSTEMIEPLKRIEERIATLEKLMMGEGEKLFHDAGVTKIRGLMLFMLAICWNALFNSSK
ncbi:hypothetical protein PIB30_041758 [Stylosanthes scabra]|uniref:Zinc finger GRF-type domain-containing protein n=1 Tax=Stylosanthes scabra TaxID=79078 RepID=A0ABU6SFU7_9FABA|nr:hypothetical protein [Stylosanthes scabra]